MTEIAADAAALACTCFRIRKLARRLTQFYDHHLQPVGLTVNQFSAMRKLSRADWTVQMLADEMGMDRTSLTRLIKPLERDGHVETAAGTDRRQRVLRLTEAGRAALERATPLWEQAQLQVNAALGEEMSGELHRVIEEAVQKAPQV